ncbi:MAG: cyclic dehypoxanthinyl futalosine synthase, partial [Bacteroidota bacterium]|nr:cyclic dehypoxanthinyl futalosine synthase [Bacteroidota bacterium]
MGLKRIYQKALKLENLTLEEAKILYKEAPISELMFLAHEFRKIHKKDAKKVGWIIDRNVNITNVCIAQCQFCNFCRTKKSPEAYITKLNEYKQKIDEMIQLGGNQLLLQGGMHPDLGLDYYTDLFATLKSLYPNIKLHALSPTEVVDLATKAKLSYKATLQELMKAGLDSLPGAGAEILSERVRKIVSPAKCSAEQWLEVMEEAHNLLLPTSATMMFGFIETDEERIEHLLKIRDLQAKKTANSLGFVTFVPWPYQPENTKLQKIYPKINQASSVEYLRLLAVSRIILNNIENIQASWLTVGKEVAQLALYGGANDLGSIMIEENVVSAAGANYTMNVSQMKKTIL